MWVIINVLRKPSLGLPSRETKILQAENMSKVDDFEPIYFGKYRIDGKLFVFFEHTINRLSFGCVRLPLLEYYFSSFFVFSDFFSFPTPAIYF